MAELLLSEDKGVKTYLVENTKWGKSSICKELENPYPSEKQVSDFLHEYNLLKDLDITGIRKTAGQDNEGEKPKVYFNYFEGINLKKLVENEKVNLDLTIAVGIFLADTLTQLHKRKIIHKAISAKNILYNVKSQEFCLIDFSCASTIRHKQQLQGNPEVIDGDLDYISPEQTGRMNRRVDHRSDLYSLGIVLYEMLTGVLPFPDQEPRDTVYGHIAVVPENPIKRNGKVPQLLGDIVMKLIEKDGDSRYQSAIGLKRDLEQIQSGLIQGKEPGFEIAKYDNSFTLNISQKLYGREKEINELSTHLEQAAQGNFGIAMVSGYSGSGKSSLVHEVYKGLPKNKGYFISGKFDQLQRNIPYYAIRQALKEYFKFLLTEDGELIDKTRQKILKALGNEAGLIIEIIPELEHIIGRQQKVTAVSGILAQNRFNYVFNKFLKAIIGPGHPIVLFIDDLQWADLASLNLISNIIRDQGIKYLLLLGSFRENEVSAAHPVSRLIKSCEEDDIVINRVHVENLNQDDILNLLSDTLKLDLQVVKPLAKTLFNHTDGNAFYVTQIIQSLFEQGFLSFDDQQQRWTWDDNVIGEMEIPDNVVDLMIQRVQRLESATQNLLKKASCIGNSFLTSDLELLLKVSFAEFEKPLISAQEEGLILEESEGYRFLHDRIQQAVYSLIPEDDRKKLHYEFGLELLQLHENEEGKIFAIVDQLNFGLELVRSQADRIRYAELNLEAGKLAKSSTAYDASYGYLSRGLIFSNNDWELHYQLVLDLHTYSAEAAYLMADYQAVERHIGEVLQNSTQLLHQIPALKIEIEALKSQNNLVEAVEKGLQALNKLKVRLPYKPSKLMVFAKLITTRIQLLGKNPESLIKLKDLKDPHMLAAMQILVSIGPAIYWASPNLTPLTIFKMLLISVRYGNTDESAFAYSTFGLLLCGVTGEIKLGNRYGNLALELAQKVNPINKVKGIFNVYCFVNHWSHPLSDSFKPFQEAHLLGQASGDLEFSALSAYLYCNHAFYAGKPLTELAHDFESYSSEIRKIKQYTSLNYNLLHWQTLYNLTHETHNPVELNGPIYDEKDMLAKHEKANDKTALFKFHLLKMMLNYLFGNIIQAYEHRLKAAQYLDAVTGMYVTVEYYFYSGLVAAAKILLSEVQTADGSKRDLKNALKKLKKWAKNCPQNNLHKYQLLKAEYYNILGKADLARANYKASISSARTHGFINELALAYERGGKFYLQQKEDELAHFFLANSYISYQQWGATTKCNELKFSYKLDQFLELYLEQLDQNSPISSSTALEKLDISSITETAEIIADEIEFDKLKTTLLKILTENAGAEKAILFLVKDKQATIEESWPDQRNKTRSFPELIINQVLEQGEIVVTDRAMTDTKFKDDEHVLKNGVRSALCLPLFHQNDLIAIIYLENNLVYGAFSPNRLEFLHLISGQMAISLKNATLYQNLTDAYEEQVKLKDAYGKFVPKDFLKFLGKDSILDVALGDQIQKTVTVMFIDIVDYTTLSEKMSPKENFDFINGCLRLLGPVLRHHGGFISQFLGDGVMAIFKDDPATAVEAAIEIQKTLSAYNIRREKKNRMPVKVGVGLHTDKVMLGIIGEQERMDQNVISDGVNVASRVQELTRTYKTGIILTGSTLNSLVLNNKVNFRYLGKTSIKGREETVEIFECLNGLETSEEKLKLKTIKDFNGGVKAFYDEEYSSTITIFKQLLEVNPDDAAAKHFLELSLKSQVKAEAN